MTDILTRLAALTATDEHGLLECECGNTDIEVSQGYGNSTIASCERCGKTLRDSYTGLIERWNDRPREQALIALVQEAAAEIQRLKTLALGQLHRANSTLQSLDGEGMTPHCRSVLDNAQKRLLQQAEQLRRAEPVRRHQNLNPQETAP